MRLMKHHRVSKLCSPSYLIAVGERSRDLSVLAIHLVMRYGEIHHSMSAQVSTAFERDHSNVLHHKEFSCSFHIDSEFSHEGPRDHPLDW
jgi:hypothetical protein